MKMTKTGKLVLLAAIAGSVVALTAQELLAQATPVAPAQSSPAAAARKEVADAQLACVRSKAALQQARKKVEVTFSTANPAYATALHAVDKAENDLKVATTVARDNLNSNPDYKALLAAVRSSKEKRDALQAQNHPDSDELTNANTQVFTNVTALRTMETGAMETDPKVVEAKQKLTDARQALTDFKSQIDDACKSDAEYAQAQQADDAAQQRLVQAKASLTTASRPPTPVLTPPPGRPSAR